jgi:Rrf2 family protein
VDKDHTGPVPHVIPITWSCTRAHRPDFAHFGQLNPKGMNAVIWPAFPKRLQSALKALCCLAQSGEAMQSQNIAERIRVSTAETAKILQLLVWGGFVTSRRGSKGGFHLAARADRITMRDVIDFFLSRHPAESDTDFSVMRIFEKTSAPCQKAFGKLTLADIESIRKTRHTNKKPAAGATRKSTKSRRKTR